MLDILYTIYGCLGLKSKRQKKGFFAHCIISNAFMAKAFYFTFIYVPEIIFLAEEKKNQILMLEIRMSIY